MEQIKRNEGSLFRTLPMRMNRVLIRVADLELNGKDPDRVTLQDVFGNLDVWGYLILLISLVGTVAMSLLSAMLFLTMLSESLLFVYPAAVIGVASGILLFYCLFRIRRWVRS